MDTPKHNAEQEAQELLQKMAMNGQYQQQTKRVGG